MDEFDSEILIGKYLDNLLLSQYFHEVKQANRKFNLFSRNLNTVDMRLMVAESLLPLELDLVPADPGPFLDIGTGWGIPAIPLLMAREEIQFVLAERSQKKADFLRLLLQRLKLAARVENCDLKELESPERFSGFTLRRVAVDDKLIKRIGQLAAPGAFLIYFGPDFPGQAFESTQVITYSIDRLPGRQLTRAQIS